VGRSTAGLNTSFDNFIKILHTTHQPFTYDIHIEYRVYYLTYIYSLSRREKKLPHCIVIGIIVRRVYKETIYRIVFFIRRE
jgi:hypothetical protein